ncbi:MULTISPECIES: cellulose-binding protein [unclassified Coleofasciculus]|uniref:cellulose-binding protein n=1 Tax=unclassified Coleofasciculus TaxID=2692782 RepID=UPI001882BB35|nr:MULTISPECIES: cellulose-binding protein [unclassified Coleofasciculus]MBE9125780.1 cellulose-binding protein [Coleofasciculus sp. LEGE 07081]MBE9148453.1 cellulose-binding protein [Coleofasciculus sp. LEGE 07092]
MKFVKFIALFGAALILILVFSNTVNLSKQTPNLTNANNYSQEKSALGTNLNGIADWSTEIPFLDIFKSSRKWITQCAEKEPSCSGSWSTNEFDKLNLDEHGWVKSLPAPDDSPEYTRVSTLMFRDVGRYPGGQYVVLYDGEGTLEYGFDAAKDKTASKPGRDVINVTPSNGGIFLTITSTDPNKTGNYIRNIRVIPANYEDKYQSLIFNPEFIKKITKFQALRFMDWMKTNNSEQKEWENRPKLEDASYAWKGVPLEIMVDLANRLKVDPWFTLPHMATDDYITNFAKLVKENLAPNLTIYLEYSNEVWNAQFKQFHWVRDNGVIPGGTTSYQPYGVRTAQMCDVWKGVFGEERQRIKCVMATQTANPWVADQVLNCDKWKEAPCYKHGIDALAITGYFSGRLGKPEFQKTIESWLDNPKIDEFERALTQLKDGSVLGTEGDNTTELVKRFNDYSKIAKDKGLELLAYEGGTHVVGTGGVENNERITKFFIELHRRPEFYDRYKEMLEAWKDPEGTRTLFMHFVDIGKPSKWGSWGALEHVDQESSPKYDALIDFMDQNS